MKTLIAVPCQDMMHTRFVSSLLSMRISGAVEFTFAVGSLVYDARNQAAQKAVNGGFDRILWLDSDMTFDPDFFQRMSARLDEGHDFVTALAFTRKDVCKPTIYKFIGHRETEDGLLPVADSMEDYPRDSIFKVAGSGMAGVMMTTEVVAEMADKYKLPFSPALGFGEDLSFCLRMQDMGREMWCDSSIKMGHMAHKAVTEETYLKGGL